MAKAAGLIGRLVGATEPELEAIDLAAWQSEKHAIPIPFTRRLSAIVARDTEFQVERGGAVTSTLTEAAEQVAAKVARERDQAVASYVQSKEPALKREHIRRLMKARDAASGLAQALSDLQAFEYRMNEFLAPAIRRTIASADLRLNAENFATQAQRVIDPPAPRPAPARPVPIQAIDFSDLLA
jgi:hypothetical protein